MTSVAKRPRSALQTRAGTVNHQGERSRLNVARERRDLADPPGNRLGALKGKYAGFFSTRVNDQYRIVFRFEHGDASEVRIVDYH